MIRDQVQILFCDFDLDEANPFHRQKLLTYLTELHANLLALLHEEEVWITYHSITRIS